jgi:TusA-related sulfurtransferase
VLFTPAGAQPTATNLGAQPADVWPDPVVRLDNRDLDPPEPMVRILSAAESLKSGETLSALLRREPVFLFPHLEKRGFRWLGGFTADGSTYELTVRAPT